MQPTRFKKKLATCLKISISAGLICYLIWLIDWGRAANAIQQADKQLFLLAPCSILLGMTASSYRWILILRDHAIAFAFRTAYRGYLVGNFYSIFLPGVIGGDVVRIVYCVKETRCDIAVASASVFVERASGIIAICGFMFVASWLFAGHFPGELVTSLQTPVQLFSGSLFLGLIIFMAGARFIRARVPSDKWRNPVGRFLQSGLMTIADLKWTTFISVLLLSAFFQSGDIVGTFILSKAIGISLPLHVFFVFVPIIYFATVLPISMGGIGVREGTIVILLSQLGVEHSMSITLSFLIFLNRVLIGGFGGIVQYRESFDMKK
jgi:uncharacterized protein (TIRG00374 family)